MSKRRNKKNRTRISLLIILIIIILIVLVICSYYLIKKHKDIEVKDNDIKIELKENLEIEINSDIILSDFVKSITNGEIVNKNDKVDTSTLGDIELELLIKNNRDEEEKYKFKVMVVDTINPVIEAKKEITIYVGNKVNLLEEVKVTDNSLEDIKASVVGEYDINKVGEYKLKYEAVDSSSNKSEYDFVLKVINDPNNKTFTTSKGFSGKVINGVTYIDGVLIVNKSYGLPSSYGNGLTSETTNAFYKMQADAKAIGLNLVLSSGWRSYWDQQTIYNGYVARDGKAAADTYSARPGYSEHQSGLTFDLNSISNAFSYTEEGKWVHNNCYKYGFILRYPKGKESITGYMYESWHLRYVGVDLASKLYNDGDWITLEEYFGIDSKYS